jgi:hypothetical protein
VRAQQVEEAPQRDGTTELDLPWVDSETGVRTTPPLGLIEQRAANP